MTELQNQAPQRTPSSRLARDSRALWDQVRRPARTLLMTPMGPLSITVLLLLSGYLLSYIFLSSFGAYAPAAFGLAGIKWYARAPAGFYAPASDRWVHTPMRIFYAPLTMADARFWHTHGRFPGDGEPIYPEMRGSQHR